MRINPSYFSLFLTLIFFSFFSTKASDIPRIGVPYVQNFHKSLYAAGNQNWSIAKNKKGIMYFGNSAGLLSYNGKYWEKHEMPNKQIVRSVAVDDKGLVYTGGFGEFGYWDYQDNKLTYHSLVKLLPKSFEFTAEIWKIYIVGKKIYFQTFWGILVYENKKIKIIKPGNLFFLHSVREKLFAEIINKGLFELKGDKLVKLAGSEIMGTTGILSILPFKENQFIIGTSKNGLFLYDGITFKPFVNQANNFLKTYQLNNGVKVLEKYYAYGTILNGVIIIDESGKIIQVINKVSGLQNNTVLSLYNDNENNLWAGLDNGIDRIELNSPLSFYFDKNGKFGTVYSSLISGNKIYLGTNQGLFFSEWNKAIGNSFDFRLIPNSQGQVWDISKIDNQIICGHNDGTFSVQGDRIEKISNTNGGWNLKKLSSNSNYLIQGTYTGLAIYIKNGEGNWIFSHRVEGFGEPSKYVEQDQRGNIWVSHAYKGLYRISLTPDLKKAVKVKYYDEAAGLPSSFNINTFNLESKIVFSSDSGFFVYDEISNRFSKYNELNKKLAGFSFSNKIIKAENSKYWFINHGRVGLVSFSEPGKIAIDSNRFNILDGRMVQYYENISQISESIYLISIDDGFAIYNNALAGSIRSSKKLPQVLIGKIEDITNKYSLITETGDSSEEIEIPYSKNSIRISFALPYYRLSKIKFQYFFEGYSKQWSEWSTATQKDFTDLSYGSYTFKVRAKIDDQTVSEVSTVKIIILAPWYASNWAWAFYFICIITGLIIGKRIYEAKLKRDQQKIADALQKEQEEYLKKKAEDTEKQIGKLEKEKLQTELAGKSRELANSAMSLVYKNELLQKISQELNKLKENKDKPQEDQLRKIQKIIDDGMNDERDWNLFENSFNEAHESFFKKLKVNHPDLVPNDLKLCAYLRMNMSSKEMASLLNISVRGVEIRRYRLRKKLAVPHDKNLTEFLIEL
ncbi:two-component regulator propeller domain-containing protein [Pedobacter xixiisoli]|uniref:Y_Y_Y domain-containing protein n=1 Tax=Pedobacter xixiisoli TaxID=1476464 RepID=A0A286AAF7_9SPHI|nr:two-component regulator propeller domain-containing protein [Pedobacter xixiisoli]SOD18893.1 Y_Y_Y domain-containing protein [Pedobacter xixiisoli]